MTTGRINQVAVRNKKKVNPRPDRGRDPYSIVSRNRLGSHEVARDGGPSGTHSNFPSVLVFSGLCTENAFTRTLEPVQGSYTFRTDIVSRHRLKSASTP